MYPWTMDLLLRARACLCRSSGQVEAIYISETHAVLRDLDEEHMLCNHKVRLLSTSEIMSTFTVYNVWGLIL